MNIKDFALERYFAKHEFTAKHLLSSSDCDGYPLNFVLESASAEDLNLWQNQTLGYTESQGNPILREAILSFYRVPSIENVLVATPGELNFISMNVLLRPTDHAVVVSPGYQSLYEIINSLGAEVSFWKPEASTWEFNTADLESLIKPNTKLIVLNFPHNPTGAYLNLGQLNEIVNIAQKHDLHIFSDEMYHKLLSPGTLELPPISDIYHKGISLWGTSKTFGLAGLRTGWLVSQNIEFIQKVLAFKDYLSICNSGPSEILSIMALHNIDYFLKPNQIKINDNVALFKKFAASHTIFDSFVPPKAGSTAFVKLNIKTTSLEFSDRLVEEAGIMTLPAEMFEFEGKYIRLGFGRKNFAKALEVFDAYLSDSNKSF